MSTASRMPATGSANPTTSAAPPATSTRAAYHAESVGAGMPILVKLAVVPPMPHWANFW